MNSSGSKVDVPILWIENSQSDAPVIVLCPGLAMSAAKYQKFGESLRNKGFHVAVCELRGQGGYVPGSGRTEDHGLAEIVGIDMPAVLEAVKSRFPGSGIVLAGHSLGGCVASLAAAVRSASSDSLVGVVTVATSTGYYKFFGEEAGVIDSVPNGGGETGDEYLWLLPRGSPGVRRHSAEDAHAAVGRHGAHGRPAYFRNYEGRESGPGLE